MIGPDGSVQKRTVTISRTYGDDAIVGLGVRAGEQVVTDGQLRLVPGARVQAKPAAAADSGQAQ